MLKLIALPTATKAFKKISCSFLKNYQVRKIKNRIADQHSGFYVSNLFNNCLVCL